MPKRIEQILEERGLWSAKELNLSSSSLNALVIKFSQIIKSVLKVTNVTYVKKL